MFERFNQLFIFLNNLIFFSTPLHAALSCNPLLLHPLPELTPIRTPSPLPLSRKRARGVCRTKYYVINCSSFAPTFLFYFLLLPGWGGYFFQLCVTQALSLHIQEVAFSCETESLKHPHPFPLSRIRARGTLEKSFSCRKFCYHPALSLPVQGGYLFYIYPPLLDYKISLI